MLQLFMNLKIENLIYYKLQYIFNKIYLHTKFLIFNYKLNL